MKPVLFCDFDGVINQFPYRYERETDGSHDIAVEYGGMTNYGFAREWFDGELFYQNTDFVMLPTSKGTFPISYSQEMVDELKELIVSGKVDFRWLTTWRGEAVSLLNPLFGFPEETPYIPWQNRRSDYDHAGKGHAISEVFEENPSWRERKMVWLDDVATRRLTTWSDDEGFFVNEEANSYGFPEDKLIMLTDEFFGISRAGMDAIKKFVS